MAILALIKKRLVFYENMGIYRSTPRSKLFRALCFMTAQFSYFRLISATLLAAGFNIYYIEFSTFLSISRSLLYYPMACH